MNWPANRAHARKALSTLARPWTLRAHTQASHKYVSLSIRLSYIWCKHNRARTSQSTSQMQVLWLGLYTWLMLLSIKSLLFHQELCISFWYRQISSPRLCMTYIQCDHSPGWPNAGQVTACIVHRGSLMPKVWSLSIQFAGEQAQDIVAAYTCASIDYDGVH